MYTAVSLPAGLQMGRSLQGTPQRALAAVTPPGPQSLTESHASDLPGRAWPIGRPYLLASAHLTRMVSTTGRRSLCSLILSARLWQGVYTSMARRVF